MSAARALMGAFAVFVVLAFTVVLMSGMLGYSSDAGAPTFDGIRLGDPGETVDIEPADEGRDESVFKTTGLAVNLTGASDSYLSSDDAFRISNNRSWTVSVWAWVDKTSQARSMTAIDLDGQVLISYNGSASQYEAWYYDEGSADSYQVNVSDSSAAGNYSNIMVWANGSHLSIYENNTQGEIVDITGSNIDPAPVNYSNWDGRLEEFRSFNESLNSSQRANLTANATQQQPTWNTTSRVYFDDPNGDELVFYTATSLTERNVSYSPGFARQQVSESGDYDWETRGPNITAEFGGALAGAPGAFANYTSINKKLDGLIPAMADYAGLAVLVPLLLVVVALIAATRSV